MTYLERVKKALADGGIDVRDAAEHTGECKSAYAVTRDGGMEARGPRVCVNHVSITLYAPYRKAEDFGALKDAVSAALTKNDITPDNTGMDDTDNAYKALVCEITVSALCSTSGICAGYVI